VDVSALGGVKELSLRNCPRVTNASGLGTVKRLNIYRTAVTDFSAVRHATRRWTFTFGEQ